MSRATGYKSRRCSEFSPETLATWRKFHSLINPKFDLGNHSRAGVRWRGILLACARARDDSAEARAQQRGTKLIHRGRMKRVVNRKTVTWDRFIIYIWVTSFRVTPLGAFETGLALIVAAAIHSTSSPHRGTFTGAKKVNLKCSSTSTYIKSLIYCWKSQIFPIVLKIDKQIVCKY
jgi:hypothetical protein